MRLAALDDDVSQLDLIQRSVRSIGYDCQLFERGQALLRELRRDSFDLLIVDAFTSDAVPVHLMTAEALRLDVPHFDPAAYYNLVKTAPVARSKQGQELDRVLRALGKD